jgi:hypothetical protein
MSTEERVAELEKAFVQLTQLAVDASERADTHESWINILGTRTAELATAQVELTRAQARTEAALAETNERLNSLINVVERIISEGRNGNS